MSVRPIVSMSVVCLILCGGCRLHTHSYKTVRVRVLDAEQRPELGVQGAMVRVEAGEGMVDIRFPKPDMAFTDQNGEASLRVPTGEYQITWEVFETGYCGYSELVSQVKDEVPPDFKVFRIWKCPQELVEKSIQFTSQ